MTPDTSVPDIFFDTIHDMVVAALGHFYQYDADLIDINPNEPTISTKIGMWLFYEFFNWQCCGYRVDCEYNKKGGEEKWAPPNTAHRMMRPDILLHKRATSPASSSKGNILFCEVKKERCSPEDEQKIQYSLTDEYNYLFGLSIHDIKQDSVELKWFKNQDPETIDEKYCYDDKTKQLHMNG